VAPREYVGAQARCGRCGRAGWLISFPPVAASSRKALRGNPKNEPGRHWP
jgi:hypothetical protein